MDPNYLKAIRKAKGLSLRALAKEIGVSHTLLYLYEKGKRKLSKDVTQKLLKVLQVENFDGKPLPFVLRPLYRVEKGAREKELKEIEKEVLNLLSVYVEIETIAKSAGISLSKFQTTSIFSKKYPVKKMDDLEDIVLLAREELSLGKDPIHNVTEFLEDMGVRVIYVDGLKDFWAMAFEINDGPPVITLKRGSAGDRGRFSLLHELGHLILDTPSSLDIELVCNRFAGAFLFPESEVKSQFGEKRRSIGIEELKIAKFKYGISMSGILHRLLDLRIITRSLYNRYREEFSRKGWLIREPVELEKESPKKIKRLLLILEQEGVIDVRTRMEYEYKLFGIWGV